MSENETKDKESSLIIKEKSKKKSFIMKYGGLIFIIAVIAVFVFLAVSGINFGQWLANLAISFSELSWWGIYLGVFIISIFGNFTVIFPVPYVVAIIVISAVVPGVNPLVLGVAAGLGASIGEVSAWLIGRGSKEFVGESERMEKMSKYIDKGWAPLLIFIFAATPLPDDAFLIVLGFAGYSIIKTLIWCFLGKVTLCSLMSAVPIWLYAVNPQMGDLLLGLFGINLADAQSGIIDASEPKDLIISTVMWISTIVILFLVFYVDWGKVFKKSKKDDAHPDMVLKEDE